MRTREFEGVLYRVLEPNEIVQPDDLAAWAHKFRTDMRLPRAGLIGTDGYRAKAHSSIAYLRPVEPLIAEMVRVRRRKKQS